MSCFLEGDTLCIKTSFISETIPLQPEYIVSNGSIYQQCGDNGLIRVNIMFGLNEALISFQHYKIQCRYDDSVKSYFMKG
jgi:hypothetical protein